MKHEKCPNCGSNQKLTLVKDIGYDVHEEGEERQHLQKCKCGYERMVIDFYPFDRSPFRLFCKWHEERKDYEFGC